MSLHARPLADCRSVCTHCTLYSITHDPQPAPGCTTFSRRPPAGLAPGLALLPPHHLSWVFPIGHRQLPLLPGHLLLLRLMLQTEYGPDLVLVQFCILSCPRKTSTGTGCGLHSDGSSNVTNQLLSIHHPHRPRGQVVTRASCLGPCMAPFQFLLHPF